MKLTFKILFLLLLTACNNKQETSNTSMYFDLKTYFEKEAVRLQKHDLILTKTVNQNGESEKKDIKIADWKSEFAFFTASDINKPAWRNSYRVIKNGNQLTYLSQDNGLRTKKIEVYSDSQGIVKRISIFNKTSNLLYTSTEELQYFPDSIYTINKQQKLLLNGMNTYEIKSEFKNAASNK